MKISKHILSIVFIIGLVLCQACFVVPDKVNAETAGDTLVVRVGYFGDDKDYRVKAKLSKSDIESLPQQTNRYTNLTSVGTIMSSIAKGPTLKSVLDTAGIDVGSTRLLHMRTVDSKGNVNNWYMDFPASKYIGSTLYYYPNLVENWKKTGEGSGIPQSGALQDAVTVDSILAIQSYTTKSPSQAKKINEDMLSYEDSYRLCAGQKKLTELAETREVSSHESAKWIYGIDVTLWGSPGDATELSLNIQSKNIMVGSSKRISATVKGQELFENRVNTKLKWSSSDESIATVDSQGNVTVKKKGKVTITARTSNGLEKSVVINGTNNPDQGGNQGTEGGTGNNKSSAHHKSINLSGDMIKAIEIQMGDKIMEGVVDARPVMAENAIELNKEEASPIVVLIAAVTAVIIFCIGIVLRILRYRREV